jgi:anti-anti-sigma factor
VNRDQEPLAPDHAARPAPPAPHAVDTGPSQPPAAGCPPVGGAHVGRADATDSNRVLADNGHFSISRRGDTDPVRLVLAGEVDVGSVPALTAVLRDAADGAGVLHVDLADVYFCDLAALRVIIGLDQSSDHPGRPVVLHHLPASLEKILRIIGWDTAPGLTIDVCPNGTSEPHQGGLPYQDG